MGVAGGGLHLVVPEELADHGKALAHQQPAAGEGVPQVVDAQIPDAGPFQKETPRAVYDSVARATVNPIVNTRKETGVHWSVGSGAPWR